LAGAQNKVHDEISAVERKIALGSAEADEPDLIKAGLALARGGEAALLDYRAQLASLKARHSGLITAGIVAVKRREEACQRESIAVCNSSEVLGTYRAALACMIDGFASVVAAQSELDALRSSIMQHGYNITTPINFMHFNGPTYEKRVAGLTSVLQRLDLAISRRSAEAGKKAAPGKLQECAVLLDFWYEGVKYKGGDVVAFTPDAVAAHTSLDADGDQLNVSVDIAPAAVAARKAAGAKVRVHTDELANVATMK
jgi:hypothetical protein